MVPTALIFGTLAALVMCAPESFPERPSGGAADASTRDKRAYSYVSEYKRLPVYNFGLGKRSANYALEPQDGVELDPDQKELLADFIDGYEPDYQDLEESKRTRLYEFGLGKRYANPEDYKRADSSAGQKNMYSFGLGKREYPRSYSFGLGKRQAPRSYSFGLGKRLSPGKFNFGLGKRERDQNRFNFGLGKRSIGSGEDSS